MTTKLFAANTNTTSSFTCEGSKIKTLGGTSVTVTSLADGKYYFTTLIDTDGNQVIPFYPEQEVEFDAGTKIIKSCTTSYFELTETVENIVYPKDAVSSKVVWLASTDLTYIRKSSVSIDLGETDIDWGLGQDYTINFTEGFVIDPTDGFSSPPSTSNYQSSSSAPYILTRSPINAGTNITNNTTIVITYDRTVKAGTGYIKLYKAGGVLVKSFDVTNYNEVSFFGSQATVKTKGYMQKNTSYYILTDANAVKDLEKIPAQAISSPTEYYFTTADATFPDLAASLSTTVSATCTAKVILFADRFLSPAEGDAVYTEDTFSNILYAPQVADYQYDGSGTYTVTVTPSSTGAVDTLTTTVGGGSQSFNATTKVLTLTGTRDQVNTRLQNIRLDGGVDYDQTFTLSYTVTTPRSSTMTKVQNVVLSNIKDYELFRVVGYDRQYYGNQSNLIWNTPWIDSVNTQAVANHPNDYQPYISDLDDPNGFGVTEPYTQTVGNGDNTSYTGTYTIELSSTSGQFSSLSDDSDKTANWSYTATRIAMETKFAQIKFWPNAGVNTNTSFNVVFKKGTTTTLSTSVNLIYQGSASITETITFTSSGTWTPTENQLLYGVLDFLIVGGGGSGADYGGGGGGGIKELLGQPLTAGTYTITVGTGGLGSKAAGTAGSNGTSSSAFGYTATGGNAPQGGYSARAGASGIPSSAGATTTRLGGSASYSYSSYGFTGGGGGGGAGGTGSNSSSSSGAGGNGGTGITSSITGLAYAGGGGGLGNNHDATITGWNGGNGGGGGSSVGGSGGTIRVTSTTATYTFATSGVANRGAGGGGGIRTGTPGQAGATWGGDGSDGIVVIRVRGA